MGARTWDTGTGPGTRARSVQLARLHWVPRKQRSVDQGLPFVMLAALYEGQLCPGLPSYSHLGTRQVCPTSMTSYLTHWSVQRKFLPEGQSTKEVGTQGLVSSGRVQTGYPK